MGESAAASSLSVGTMLAETYRVTRLLGRGGMGSVWEAEHARLPGKKVAIKVLHAEVADDSESLARFRREAEIASRLGHPNIVDVHDFNVLPSGAPYLVLEYLEGEDLAGRLSRGPMPLDEVASVVRQIGSALQAAHQQNIVHRDLKPQNIFLVSSEAGGFMAVQAKVLDFGISKIRGSQTIKTNASDMLGTPQYMAPEQATGQHDAIDGRTDVFALGAMVYEMLAGVPAFPGQSIPEVVFKVVYENPKPLRELAQVPPGVADAIHKALEKKQEERFANVSGFVEALTGSPLHTLRTGAVIARPDGYSAAAPTNSPVRTSEAVAATIDSGRAAIDDALAGTVASAKAPLESRKAADGHASTVASDKLPLDTSADPVGHASTVASDKLPLDGAAANDAIAANDANDANDAPIATVDAQRSAAPTPQASAINPVADTAAAPAASGGRGWIGLGLIAVAGAAVAVALILKGGDGASRSTPAPVNADTQLAGASPADTQPASGPADAGSAVATAKALPLDAAPGAFENAVTDLADSVGAGVTKAAKDLAADLRTPTKSDPAKKDPTKKAPSGSTAPAKALPASVRKDIAKATAHLRSRRSKLALVAALRANRTQRTDAAFAIIARAYCQRQDLGLAVSTLKQIKKRRIRRLVIRACADEQVDIAP